MSTPAERRDPANIRALRIAQAIAVAVLAMVITPQALLRAVTSLDQGEQIGWALAFGLIVLGLVLGGYELMSRTVSRTDDHQLVAKYLSVPVAALTAAARLSGYVLVVVLAAGYAVSSLIHMPRVPIHDVGWLHGLLILLLAIPVIVGWTPPPRLLVMAQLPAMLLLAATFIVGFWQELTGGIPWDAVLEARADTLSAAYDSARHLPFIEACVVACLGAALIGFMTERSLGEVTSRRVRVISVGKLMLPSVIGILLTVYLIVILDLPGRRMSVPILTMSRVFLGEIFQIALGVCLIVAAFATALAAYAQLPLYMRLLATDGILPRHIAAADARLQRRSIIGVIAVLCATVAFAAQSTLGVTTIIVFVMFAGMGLTMMGLAARGRMILRNSTIPAERATARLCLWVGRGLAALAIGILVMVVLSEPEYALAALACIVVPGTGLLILARGRGKIGESLAAGDLTEGRTLPTRVHGIILLTKLDRPTLQAISFARATRPSSLTGLVVDVDPEMTERLLKDWKRAELPVELRILGTPRGAARRPVIDHIRSLRAAHPRDIVTIFAPRVVSNSASWQRFFVRHSTPRLLSELKLEPRVVIAEVPYQIDDTEEEE